MCIVFGNMGWVTNELLHIKDTASPNLFLSVTEARTFDDFEAGDDYESIGYLIFGLDIA